MRDVTSQNFGLLIAYLLPGFVALWGLSFVSPTVRTWLGLLPGEAPTVGGFLYVTLASVAAGLVASTVRWMVLDTIHHRTGIPQPAWDFSRLADRVAAFSRLVDDHYVYYKANGNALVAIVFAWGCRRLAGGFPAPGLSWFDVGCLFVAIVLFIGSRDTLRRYYARGTALLQSAAPPGSPSPPAAKSPPAGTTPSTRRRSRVAKRRVTSQ